MARVIKPKTLSNRIIRDNAKCKQWYCPKCNYAHNELIIYNKESFCKKCFKGNIKDLDVYNQNGKLIKKGV